MFWDAVLIMFSLIILFYVTVHIAFIGSIDKEIMSQEIIALVIYIYMVEFFVQMNTAFFRKGNLVFDHFEIIDNYLKKKFLSDLVTILPNLIHLHVQHDENTTLSWVLHVLNLLHLGKLAKFSRIFKKLSE